MKILLQDNVQIPNVQQIAVPEALGAAIASAMVPDWSLFNEDGILCPLQTLHWLPLCPVTVHGPHLSWC